MKILTNKQYKNLVATKDMYKDMYLKQVSKTARTELTTDKVLQNAYNVVRDCLEKKKALKLNLGDIEEDLSVIAVSAYKTNDKKLLFRIENILDNLNIIIENL